MRIEKSNSTINYAFEQRKQKQASHRSNGGRRRKPLCLVPGGSGSRGNREINANRDRNNQLSGPPSPCSRCSGGEGLPAPGVMEQPRIFLQPVW